MGMFVRRLQFLSIGTNDLIQLHARHRSHRRGRGPPLRSLHPAVLLLIGGMIRPVRATDCRFRCAARWLATIYSRLLLGMGLREFSMHPSQILGSKQEILRADLGDIAQGAAEYSKMDEPLRIREAMERL